MTHPAKSYNWRHKMLRWSQGPASAHRCVDCGGPARHWSLRKDAPASNRQTTGGVFSVCDRDYEPRCERCHAKYDVGQPAGARSKHGTAWERAQERLARKRRWARALARLKALSFDL